LRLWRGAEAHFNVVKSNLMTPESPLQELPIPAPPPREPAWTVWDVLLILAFGIFISFFVTVGAVAVLEIVSKTGWAEAAAPKIANPWFLIPIQTVGYALTFIFARILITVRTRQDFWRAVHWNFPKPNAVPVYVLIGISVAVLGQIAGHFLPIPKTLPIEKLFAEKTGAYLLVAFGVLVAPLVEELLFRGLIFPVAARGLGLIGGTLLTSLLFSLIHQSQLAHAWAPLLVIFGVGLVLTVVRARTNSLAASWIVHFSYNATLFAVLFYVTNGFQHLERLAE
jgi:membrane protease YdiL (CAAX protease family)